jgi:hypothetical protein
MRTDTELLEGLIAATESGACPAVIFDDNGHWAVATEGMQTVHAGPESTDTSTSFWIPASQWRTTLRQAIDDWLTEHRDVYLEALVEKAPKMSRLNAKRLESCLLVGCYACGRTFKPAEITELTDDGQTAKCPHCGIDSVLDITDTRVLAAMCERWFSAGSTDDPANAD